MQAIRRNRRGIELACEIEREHDLRELALGISPPAGITACEHNIVKIDRLLAERGDVHNSGGLADHDKRQQKFCEQKSGEIIDGEAQFVAVLTNFSLCVGAPRADAGIVDKYF